MSTACWIGRITNGDSGLAIYCHDGRPSTTGRNLAEHYTEEWQVDAIISLGNLSTLGVRLEAVAGASVPGMDGITADITRAYHRDRGDEWRQNRPREFTGGVEGFFADENLRGDYKYLWTQAYGWLASERGQRADLQDLLTRHPLRPAA